jgi:urease accessory protein
MDTVRLPRAMIVHGKGHWSGDVRDVVVLGFEERFRRRFALRGVRGLSFLLDLPEAIALRHGDALQLETGDLVEVVAAPEPLAEIKAPADRTALRIAWHLGNRHIPVQILERRLRIRRDPVIEAMVAGLGAQVRLIEAPFDPEGGAYAGHNHASQDHASHDHASHDHVGRHHVGHDHETHERAENVGPAPHPPA